MCYVWAAYLAAAAIAGASAYSQGQQQKKVAEYNSKITAKAAGQQQSLGIAEEFRQRERVRAALSDQLASEANSGFIASTGTPLLVAQKSATEGELDALSVRYASRQRVQQLQDQSSLDAFEGRAANSNSYLSAGGALLSGYSSGKSAGAW
jgi:hypothetical protein